MMGFEKVMGGFWEKLFEVAGEGVRYGRKGGEVVEIQALVDEVTQEMMVVSQSFKLGKDHLKFAVRKEDVEEPQKGDWVEYAGKKWVLYAPDGQKLARWADQSFRVWEVIGYAG